MDSVTVMTNTHIGIALTPLHSLQHKDGIFRNVQNTRLQSFTLSSAIPFNFLLTAWTYAIREEGNSYKMSAETFKLLKCKWFYKFVMKGNCRGRGGSNRKTDMYNCRDWLKYILLVRSTETVHVHYRLCWNKIRFISWKCEFYNILFSIIRKVHYPLKKLHGNFNVFF